MSVISENLATLLNDGGLDEISLLKKIESCDPKFIEDLHEGHSSLVMAIGLNLKKVYLEILKRQSKLRDFVTSMKAVNLPKETQKENEVYEDNVGSLFLQLLDLNESDKSNFPTFTQEILGELERRKLLALFFNLEGRSFLYGIPWTMEGHHNYRYVTQALFKSIDSNKKEIMEHIAMMAKEANMDSSLFEKLISSVEETIVLMQNLSPSHVDQASKEIYAMSVGISMAGSQASSDAFLHALGLVIARDHYLFVERSGDSKPGVSLYKTNSEFDREKFDKFLEKAEKSLGRAKEAALEYLDYAKNTTHNKGLTHTGHIDMPKQGKANCTTATSEGLFVAGLYSHLVLKGVDQASAIRLSQEYSLIVFRSNKIMKIKAFLSACIKELKDMSDKLYLEELNNFLNVVKIQLKKDKILTSELLQLFEEFEKKLKVLLVQWSRLQKEEEKKKAEVLFSCSNSENPSAKALASTSRSNAKPSTTPSHQLKTKVPILQKAIKKEQSPKHDNH